MLVRGTVAVNNHRMEQTMVTKALPLGGDGGLLVEVGSDVMAVTATPVAGGEVAGFGPSELVDRLDAVAGDVATLCAKFYERTKEGMGAVRPDELTLEFALALGGEAGVWFVTKGTAEATFKISATWKHDAAA